MLEEIVQQAPFTVLIEPTEGCNLGCSFCGLSECNEREQTISNNCKEEV